MEDEPIDSNYIVSYSSFYKKEAHCETKDEVWKAISKAGWGGYQVTSPRGLNIDEFVPF